MVFVRIAILLLIVMFSLIMAGIPLDKMNAFGMISASLIFVAGPALYLLPVYEAVIRKRKNLSAIALVDLFLGWTLVGWVTAMAWALSGENKEEDNPGTKKCPDCAETIKAEARKCRYCGADVSAVSAPPLENQQS